MKKKKPRETLNVNITLTRQQQKALEEYRFSSRAQSRSDAARDILRAGLESLCASAPTERERAAAAAALALWTAHDTPPLPQAPDFDPKP